MQQFIRKLIPFLFIAIAVVALAFGLMLLAYLLLFGAIAGFVLYIFFRIKNAFFPPKPLPTRRRSHQKGRIIDSDDWKSL